MENNSLKNNSLNIELKILDARIGREFNHPQYATRGAAGLDLCACIDAPVVLKSGGVELIPSGIAVHINQPNYAAVLLPRSGLGHKHGIVLGNLTGLIDSDYQGQIFISCWNRSATNFTIKPGDRIAQLVFLPIARPQFTVVDSFKPTTRCAEGFGSTGLDCTQ